MKTKINRITVVDGKLKGFQGRTKIDEVNMEELSDAQFGKALQHIEDTLGEHYKWLPDVQHVWRFSAGHSVEVGDDLQVFRAYVEALKAGKTSSLKPKKEKVVAVKAKKEPKPKRVLTPEEIAERKLKNRMTITPDQRVRKTLKLTIEEELDAYVIEHVKSRRMLQMDRLNKVAADNGLTIKGRDNGHCKMNLQNSVKGMFLRGEAVKINGKTFTITEKEREAYEASKPKKPEHKKAA